ncbi:cyclin-A3-3-like [Patiria miniata]|uniref:Uncharacterized protein n=1 Tax=Patiria miniata TaxID=46514 RepID=A0A914B813_PATMI|nr:cyclin-A3-3-like [Patiria miniata]
MSRVLVAHRPSGTWAASKIGGYSVKIVKQVQEKSEHHLFRDVTNLQARDAKPLDTKERSFRSTKACDIRANPPKWCSENVPPCVSDKTNHGKLVGRAGKVGKSKEATAPAVRRGKRDDIQDTEHHGCLAPAREQCGAPPFGLHIAQDVEPMEFSALKLELDCMEEIASSECPEAEPENDPMLMSEYSTEIYRYLRSMEYKCVVPTSYLTGPAVTPNTRAVLINWLVQVQVHLELSEETLHLTAILLDRFLSQQPIGLNLLQLLGVSCLFVASKYEERSAPEVETLCKLTDYTYTHDAVLMMERRILHVLQFDLFSPTPMTFLEQFLKADTDEQRVEFHFANYILDLALTDASLLKYYPSERAAAATCLARHLAGPWVDEDCWTADLVQRTGYTEQQLTACLAGMARLVSEANKSPYKATTEKFSCPTYDSVSCIQGPCLIKAEFLSDL